MKDKELEEEFRAAAGRFPELESMLEELRDVMDELERAEEEDARRGQARGESDEEADEERAERARSGELGPDWQRIQKRIDEGKTTLLDVFTGDDSSPEAQKLRDQASANLGRLHDQWAKEAEEGGVENPLTQMRDARQAQADYVRSMLRDTESGRTDLF